MRHLLVVVCLGVLAVGVPACGSGSGGSGGGGGGPLFGDLTVEASLVFFTGEPAANVAVIVAGRGPFVSGTDGKILVENVPVPYDAIVFDGSGGSTDVWRGLTRSDPTFTVRGGSLPGGFGANVDGKVSGGAGLPVPPNHETRVGFGIEDGFIVTQATPDSVTGLYDETVEWAGPWGSTMHIAALQYSVDPDGLPLTFTGYGAISAPVVVGDQLMNQDIVMGPVGTTTISGMIVPSPGLSSPVRLLFVRTPGNGFVGLASEISLTPNFSYNAPEVAGVERTLLVLGVDPVGNEVILLRDHLPAPTTNLSLYVPASTGLVFPIGGVTGVGYGTEFRITASPGDRYFSVRFRPSSGPGPEIRLLTMASTFRIPDLSAYGLGIPEGATYTWSVSAGGPVATIDDAAVPLRIVFFYPFFGGDTSFTTQTDPWEFTFGS